MLVGVLALQGGFEAHIAAFRSLGANTREIRKAADFAPAPDALVLPGGESTAMLRLLENDPPLSAALADFLARGDKPVLATCAGCILVARNVLDSPAAHGVPADLRHVQKQFAVLDATVERNAYGRQNESCILHGKAASAPVALAALEMMFIRPPRIAAVGPGVQVLATREDDQSPVLVRQGKLFAATFHPELTFLDSGCNRLHDFFLSVV